ncbi:UNVERIFIED_CONTAM: hypothetical protein FKN15_028008 [Acipenser sinensis]
MLGPHSSARVTGSDRSPAVVNEDVSGAGVPVRDHGGHTAVHKEPEGHVVGPIDGGFDVQDVPQGVDIGGPLGEPVI